MGAPAWGTRIVAAVAAVAVIGVGAALAVPVVTGSVTPTVSVEGPDATTHAALVTEYEEQVRARAAEMAAAKRRQATLQQDALEAKAAKEAKATEERAEADDEAATQEKDSSSRQAKDSSDTKETKDPTESKDSTSKDSEDKDKDQSTRPDWWPQHVWAHATGCAVAEDGQSVVGTWDVWIKYGGAWVFVSASDDPDEVSGTDGDKVKVVYAGRAATLHKERDGMAKYRGGPVYVTVANAADPAETRTFQVDLWVVAQDYGTCPA